MCSVLNCDSKPESGKAFYKFPTDFDRCMQWVQNTEDALLWQEFEYGGACPFLNRYVCSDHFLDIDFTLFGDRTSGLTAEAAPFATNIKPDALDPVNLPEDANLEPTPFEPIPEHISETTSLDASKAQFLQQLNVLQRGEDVVDPLNMTIKTEVVEDDNTYLEDDTLRNGLFGLTPLHLVSLFDASSEATPPKKSVAQKRALQRMNETPEQRAIRLEKNRIRIRNKRLSEAEDKVLERKVKSAQRVAENRATESEEKKAIRRERCRLRAANRRAKMTPEERAAWRERNRIQTRERRQNEDEIQKMMRRYNNAVRVRIKRQNETEEKKMERRYKDAMRAANKRRKETPEERMERLRKDRERVQMKRMQIRMTESPAEREARLCRQREQRYRQRHPTPEMVSILKSIHNHLALSNDVKPQNVDSLMHFVKLQHPTASAESVENSVGYFLSADDSNQSEASFSTELDSSYDQTSGASFTGDWSDPDDPSPSSSLMTTTEPVSVVPENVQIKSEPDVLLNLG